MRASRPEKDKPAKLASRPFIYINILKERRRPLQAAFSSRSRQHCVAKINLIYFRHLNIG
jgi:hypothetical protein